MEITLPAGKYTLNLTNPITFVSEVAPPPIQVRVPNLLGKTISDAILLCNQQGLVLSGPTSGTINSQSPVAGAMVDIGSTVTVKVIIVGPPVGTEIKVGPGQAYAEIHQIPAIRDGDTLKIHYRATPYKAKIAVNKSNVKIVGVPGPNGERPILEGNSAIEVPWASYWSSAVSAQGIISVIPGSDNVKPVGVTIEGLSLRNCRQALAGFTKYNGSSSGWNSGAAGVALYRCENVIIKNCIIEQCDNGVFGKSYGNDAGDIKHVILTGNTISNCGVAGSDRQHNTYIEGIGTIYEYNNYFKPIAGSSGCNLKDRSAGAIIRYNIFEGGARILDLVDPEDGAPSFLQSPLWGKTFLYGNVIYNPQNGGSATMIHFGYDGIAANGQKELYAYYNTIINKNDRDAGGRWRQFYFKTQGQEKLYLANNIFHSFSPDPTHYPGDTYMVVEEYGKGTLLVMKNNWLRDLVQQYMTAGAVFDGWTSQLKGFDPGMVDALNWNFELLPTSPCKGTALALGTIGWPVMDKLPTVGWKTVGWQPRTLNSIGVSE